MFFFKRYETKENHRQLELKTFLKNSDIDFIEN